MRKKYQEKTRAEKLYEAHLMTHQKTDYSRALGCKKLGIKNAKPIVDQKNKELLVIGEDEHGKVVLSREEALGTIWFPTPAEIEKRKAECKFLFPHAQRSREIEEQSDAMSVPTIHRTESLFGNSTRRRRDEY